MAWNIVSDSSCDLRMTGFESDSIRFETVPLRIQVGATELSGFFLVTSKS